MSAWGSKEISLVQLSPAVLAGLAADDLDSAKIAAAQRPDLLVFGAYVAEPKWLSTWQRRIGQVADDLTALPCALHRRR